MKTPAYDIHQPAPEQTLVGRSAATTVAGMRGLVCVVASFGNGPTALVWRCMR
jgi:hypothetical protein